MSGEKYKILRSLNTAGTVTLAENTADGRKYALKELTEESLPIYRRISGLPPQENLMQVHEILRLDSNITAVCEFAEGQPLDELLDSSRVFRASEIRRITAQLCRAAEHLHQHGIIHRDITPKNIILDDDLNLKLIDFDIARRYSGNREQDTTLYGTVGFAPPEQYGFRETRFTADIYAIGVVLKILLNSCPDCSPAQEVLLRKISAKCTRFVPEKRYRSVGAVCRAVSRSRWIIPVRISAASAVLLAVIIAAVLMLQNISGKSSQFSEILQPAETPADETSVNSTAQTAATAVTELPQQQELHTSDMDNPGKISVTAETPAAETSVDSTSQTATTAVTELPQPPELHTSDMDNPNKISVTAETPAAETSVDSTSQTTATAVTEPPQQQELHTSDMDDPGKISVTAETPAAETSVDPTAQTAATAVTELPQPPELHTSDMDNPGKISVTTEINEDGYYEDFFKYEFYDDPAVYGEWSYCTTIPTEALTALLTVNYIKNHKNSGEHIFSALTLSDNGEARCILSNGEEMPHNSCWTNGFLICEYTEGTAAQRLFEATIGGEEFLFVAVKTGDFLLENRVDSYEVYTRPE